MKKIVEKAKESKMLAFLSFMVGACFSIHPVYVLAASYFVCAGFNILLMACVFLSFKLRGELNDRETTVKLAKVAWSRLEVLIGLYCVAATIGYAAGQLFLMIF